MNLSVNRLLTGKAILKATLTLLGQQESHSFSFCLVRTRKTNEDATFGMNDLILLCQGLFMPSNGS